MILHSIRRLIVAISSAALAFGLFVALEGPAEAQSVTVRCWREYCVTDPDTGKETCVREQIACPEDHP